MATASDVAARLIHLARSEEEPELLTHMRLQKLLYYVQGWALALWDEPIFSDRIEAWAHGPVVVSLYPRYAEWGDSPIDPEKVPEPKGLGADEEDLIGSVWEAYKGYTAAALRERTHNEPPWRKARGDCRPADKCQNEVTRESMTEYFKTLASS